MNTVTDKEKLEHLLNGGVLDHNGSYTKLSHEGMLSFCTREGRINPMSVNRTCIDFEGSVVVKRWYEDIPEEGILCFTWNDHMREKVVQIIVQYDRKYEWEYVSKSSENVQHAVPLTPEQVSLYNQLMGTAHAL